MEKILNIFKGLSLLILITAGLFPQYYLGNEALIIIAAAFMLIPRKVIKKSCEKADFDFTWTRKPLAPYDWLYLVCQIIKFTSIVVLISYSLPLQLQETLGMLPLVLSAAFMVTSRKDIYDLFR